MEHGGGVAFSSQVCVREGQSLTEFSTVPSHSYRPWKHKALIPDFPYPDLDPKPQWDPSSGSQGGLLDLACLPSQEKTPTAMLSFQIIYSKTGGLFLWMMIYIKSHSTDLVLTELLSRNDELGRRSGKHACAINKPDPRNLLVSS